MTTKTLSGVYASTYNLTAPVTTLSITASGYLGGGVLAAVAGSYTLVNHGGVTGVGYGVQLAGPGRITNAGLIANTGTAGAAVDIGGGAVTNTAAGVIRGYSGLISGAGSLLNYGTVFASGKWGVDFSAAAQVTNGSAAHTGALIKGPTGVEMDAPSTLVNFAGVVGSGGGGQAVYLKDGGAVINGSTVDAAAFIDGYYRGLVAKYGAASVTNYGLIRSTGQGNIAVLLDKGGTLTNGSAGDTSALIDGQVGVGIAYGTGLVRNFATIRAAPAGTGTAAGVVLEGGGEVVNGSATDKAALIVAPIGVAAGMAAGTVINFATIGSTNSISIYGVAVLYGGVVANGSASDTTALIEAYVGVAATTEPVTITNFATIAAGGGPSTLSYGSPGVFASGGGRVTNGSTSDTTAYIGGETGVSARTTAFTVVNFGTLAGTADGVDLAAGGRVTNGSASDTGAQIRGVSCGVEIAGGAGSLSNFGTISAGVVGSVGVYIAGGVATNGAAGDTTALIRGARGVVLGAGGVLDNYGTVAATAGYAIQVNDATARLDVQAGSVFEGEVYANNGTVDAVGGVTTISTLVSRGAVMGAGTIALDGGGNFFGAGATLTVAEIEMAGAATTVEIAGSVTDAKVWRQSAGTLTVDSFDAMTFTGTGSSFAGTVTGAGKIDFAGGSDAISNAHLSAATMVVNGASVTLAGAIVLAATLSVTASDFTIAAAGATLSGGGTLSLTNHSTNAIKGANTAATLTNLDKITGAGTISGLVLVNKAGGVINGAVSSALVINTGTAAVANAGLIESTSTGGMTIASPLANTGTLVVTAGTLAVDGAVSGAGTVRIKAGVADFGAAFAENVTFTSTNGVLELAQSTGYTGKVTGFSKTGTTSFDLLDIVFGGSTKAAYSGTTASGTLTVTDGTHTAKIRLVGDYTDSTFTVASDGHGGTSGVDPTLGRPPAWLPLLGAMAAFAPRSGTDGVDAASPRREPVLSLLVKPA